MSTGVLKLKKDSKYQEMRLIVDQIKLLEAEIRLRKNLINELSNKCTSLMEEAQTIADQLLEIEYNSLVKLNM